jgi:hypothetical protein
MSYPDNYSYEKHSKINTYEYGTYQVKCNNFTNTIWDRQVGAPSPFSKTRKCIKTENPHSAYA